MLKIRRETADGEETFEYFPQGPEDLAELDRMAEAGDLDTEAARASAVEVDVEGTEPTEGA